MKKLNGYVSCAGSLHRCSQQHNNQGWVKLKSEARNSVWTSHVGDRNSVIWAITCCSRIYVSSRELDQKQRRLKPRALITRHPRCCNCYTKHLASSLMLCIPLCKDTSHTGLGSHEWPHFSLIASVNIWCPNKAMFWSVRVSALTWILGIEINP